MTSTYVLRKNAPIQSTNMKGNGYSFNVIDVTSGPAGSNTRGWRVNCTTDASISHGDLQCVHGYLTLGSGASLANNAAVYPLSAWIDVPNSTTTGTGNVIAGLRVIFDPNNNDLSALSGGGESALIYAQTWASTGSLEHGLRIATGANTTIKNAISIGGTGSYTQIIDFTDWGANTTLPLIVGGPKDSTATAHWKFYVGDAATSATVATAVGAASKGSIFASTGGKLFIKDENGDWVEFDSTASA